MRAAISITSPLPLLCFALLLGACGGDDSEPRPTPDPGAGPGADPNSCSEAEEGLAIQLLQDFEGGVASGFYTNADGSPGSEVDPYAGASSPVATEIAGGRCGVSSYAFRMTGKNLTGWGMVFGRNFPEGARDLSDWEGVCFWARRGADSGQSLFFSVFEPETDPSGGICEAEPERPEDKCDAYGAGVGLHEEWRFFAIPFDDLRQRGFGAVSDELLVDQIIGLSWAAEPGNWEVWVDDVGVYRATGSSSSAGAAGAGG